MEKYEEAKITRATGPSRVSSLREIVDKVGKALGDYLQFEKTSQDAEMHVMNPR